MSEDQKVDQKTKVGLIYAAVGGTNSGQGCNAAKIIASGGEFMAKEYRKWTLQTLLDP
jgi:hypothetical protein